MHQINDAKKNPQKLANPVQILTQTLKRRRWNLLWKNGLFRNDPSLFIDGTAKCRSESLVFIVTDLLTNVFVLFLFQKSNKLLLLKLLVVVDSKQRPKSPVCFSMYSVCVVIFRYAAFLKVFGRVLSTSATEVTSLLFWGLFYYHLRRRFLLFLTQESKRRCGLQKAKLVLTSTFISCKALI